MYKSSFLELKHSSVQNTVNVRVKENILEGLEGATESNVEKPRKSMKGVLPFYSIGKYDVKN